MNQIGREENLTVTFGFAYRYTNFSVNTFFLSKTSSDQTVSGENQEHEVRIYRFWAYDPSNDMPQETVYFLKMTQIMNVNNSSQQPRLPGFTRRNQLYPKDGFNNMANYLIHSGYNNIFEILRFFEYNLSLKKKYKEKSIEFIRLFCLITFVTSYEFEIVSRLKMHLKCSTPSLIVSFLLDSNSVLPT